jgi:hypothetical protein
MSNNLKYLIARFYNLTIEKQRLCPWLSHKVTLTRHSRSFNPSHYISSITNIIIMSYTSNTRPEKHLEYNYSG